MNTDRVCLGNPGAHRAGFTVIGLVTIMAADVWTLLLKLSAAAWKAHGALRVRCQRNLKKIASLP
jgi:hypothetical protein